LNILLDTHLLLWIASEPERVPEGVLDLLLDDRVTAFFSAANIWEIAIKSGQGRPDFELDASLFRRKLLDHGYLEIDVTGAHAAHVQTLPAIHRDPFDRILIAQSQLENMPFYTRDSQLAQYPGPIIRV
jgi:PIN domain nuclease of toxin-antitoxin system